MPTAVIVAKPRISDSIGVVTANPLNVKFLGAVTVTQVGVDTEVDVGAGLSFPVLDGGAAFGNFSSFNFQSGFTLVDAGGGQLDITVAGTGIDIEDDGAPQGSATTVNFTGEGVEASVAAGVATVNVPGNAQPNLLVNPEFHVSQRTVSTLSPSTDTNFSRVDRWYGLVEQATSINIDTQAPRPIFFGIVPNGFASAGLVTAGILSRFGIAQWVYPEIPSSADTESAKAANLDVTLSIQRAAFQSSGAPAAANITLRYAILEVPTGATRELVNDWTSTTYTPGNFFDGINVTNVIAIGSAVVGAFDASTITQGDFTTPDPITGVASSDLSDRNLVAMIWTEDEVDPATRLSITGVKLEVSPEATDYLSPTYWEEFQKCRHYYQRLVVTRLAADTPYAYPVKLAQNPVGSSASGGAVISSSNTDHFIIAGGPVQGTQVHFDAEEA